MIGLYIWKMFQATLPGKWPKRHLILTIYISGNMPKLESSAMWKFKRHAE